ncbi:MAG: amidohydrolase family protein [Microthrixaceae bacterium]|nr:amidohydrolase family protein [Microthrixaceae bacterium]
MGLLLKGVEVRGRGMDVEIRDGRIHRIGADLSTPPGTEVVAGRGGALIPGLHDHHIHLASLAAAMDSLRVGPPEVTSASAFADALRGRHRRLAPGLWLRAAGYHESVAGDLDRFALDRVVADRPVRVQHRSGIRWTLNSVALRTVDADDSTHPGIERDDTGAPTGRIDRADDWLRATIGESGFPDLTEVGAILARHGVTGVTDCTPYRTPDGPEAIATAVRLGQLRQRVVLTGHADLLDTPPGAEVESGPVKIVLDEADLPDFDDLIDTITRSHAAGRPVAIHLVTGAATAFALSAWRTCGSHPGDRIEHGSLISPKMVELLARLDLTVVTQPGFVAERGDEYLAEVDPGDVANLYRCASLRRSGIAVAASTDAPYTDADPWKAIRAATRRRTRSGAELGPTEAIDAPAALAMFTCDPLRPGRAPTTLSVGSPADLCLLHLPLAEALVDPRAENVRATLRRGVVVAGHL